MSETIKYWASGDWQVRAGEEEEFVKRWTEFLTWTKGAAEGFLHARLIRDLNEPRHYVSFSRWLSAQAMADWQAKPEFTELIGACRALCEDMHSGAFGLAVAIDV
ncbi:antibiotic biosynthesis monooxygenase family protein [Streptomyces sp. NBC_00091]|uniref:antibiotic biosynthesis monooxygenase family protein n=1 Tax=Streptomyces sp. NBC_00091 TaxID=2975648 RepID=UPI00225AA131|nr:antibiotic biosynthesis monooxygenase family protein [Streptomyces sp. NBC_00091]MCX5376199.1 antibiotic biosynthesis monooxygenase [Streptomyces sp. NBC_00091]